MSKSLTASKKVMKTYLSELLTDPDAAEKLPQKRIDKPTLSKPIAHKENRSLEKLLKTVGEPNEKVISKKVIKDDVTEIDLLPISTEKSRSQHSDIKDKSYRQGNFQAMFFDVAGLTIAVPLIELGGIHKIEKITSLMGKPDWFKGVMLYRDEKINVVDTALWVMPEKCNDALKESLNYQYIIMLNDSPWGLMAEQLVDTVVLSQDEVKWLDSTNKRPWLAGLVKEKMCALLDVSALIELLDKGSDISQEQ
jgi:purine-binding chemotaxis protein CheW